MGLDSIKGEKFKKMVMKAAGTKGYLSSSVQSSLKQTGAQKFLKSGTKVSRQQATKIIQKLKKEGLTSGLGSDATKYVKRGFAQEARRQDNIKKQNIADRNTEIQAEETAAAKTANGKQAAKPGTKSMQRAPILNTGAIPGAETSTPDGFVGSSFGTTNVKHSSQIPESSKPGEWPQEWKDQQENLDDLAID